MTGEESGRRRFRVAYAAAAVIATVTLLVLGFGMTFFADEWAFIERRSLGDPSTWLAPHNEHWTTLPILLYRAMVETIGIGSYVPYLAVVAVLHVVVATFVYLLLEHASGPRFALAGSVIVLFFGSGFENLYWGFQTGFIGSLLLGLAAMVVTDRGPTRFRVAIVASLLLAAVMCSTIGVIVTIAVGIEWLMDRRWRDAITAILLPAVVLLAWLLTVGRDGVLARDPLTLAALTTVPGYILSGLDNAAGAITGLPAIGVLLAFIAVPLGLRRWRAGTLPARAVAILLAISAQYLLTALARGPLGAEFADYTRYTYVAGILAMVALGDLLGPVTLAGGGPRRLATVAAMTVWLTLALSYNGLLLVAGRELFLDRADMTRALVTVALDPDPPDGAQLERSLILVPPPVSLQRIAAAYGDPRGDALVPFAVRPIPPDVLREANRQLNDGAPIPGESD